MNALQRLSNNENEFENELNGRADWLRAEIMTTKHFRPWRVLRLRRLRAELRKVNENLNLVRGRYWTLRNEIRTQLWRAHA